MIDGFDQSNAAPALYPVASAGPFVLNGCKKILEDGLVAAEVTDGSRRRALVFIRCVGFARASWSVSEICRDDAVMLENNSAFGPGDFDTPRVAGIRGGGSMENSKRAAGKFECGDGGVFGFDFMQHSCSSRLHANDITKQPEQQIDSVDTLID